MKKIIKHKPIFGNQNWFNGKPDECEIAVRFDKKIFIGKFVDGKSSMFGLNQLGLTDGCLIGRDGTNDIIAMRRVIEISAWSEHDKEIGKLPPIGTSVEFYLNEKLTLPEHMKDWSSGDRLDILAHVMPYDTSAALTAVVHNRSNNCKYPVLTVCNACMRPIESAEEKSYRLKKEWSKQAQALKGSLHQLAIEDIYDALMSGELPHPKEI